MAVTSEGTWATAVASSRLDAEFFDPEDLALVKKLRREGGIALHTICDVLNGRTPTDYVEDGEVPIVRSGDLVAPFIYPDCGRPFLRAKQSPALVTLQAGDVLVSSIGMGSIGKISLVMDATGFATVSEVTILRSRNYPPELLFAYLTTTSGQRQINRQVTGATGQQHLLKSKMETVIIPAEPDSAVTRRVRKACKEAWQLEMQATEKLAEVHRVFADATGVKE